MYGQFILGKTQESILLTEKQIKDKKAYLQGLEDSINRKIDEIREAQQSKTKQNVIASLQSDVNARRRLIVKLKKELGLP